MTASSGQRGSRGESAVDKAPFTGAAVAEDELTEEDISVKREAAQMGIWNDEEEDPYVSGCEEFVGVGTQWEGLYGAVCVCVGGDECCVGRRDAGSSLLRSGNRPPPYNA